MSKDIALYNKYRPSTFGSVIGQDHVTKLIENEIENKALRHCIILYGPPGTGKTTMARLIGKALNPSPHGTIEKDSALEGGKDNVKSTQMDLYNMPFSGEYKTIIYDEAHEITKASFSSLLKITEEAPKHVKFIFVTSEFDKIPLAIKSRSTSYSFNRLKNSDIQSKIEEILDKEGKSITSNEVKLIIQASAGSLRNAIVALETILNQKEAGLRSEDLPTVLGILGGGKLNDFVLAHVNRDFATLNSLIGMFYPDKTDTVRAISELQQYVMDLRLVLIIPEMIKEIKSDISTSYKDIISKIKTLDENKSFEAVKAIGHRLDTLYDLTIQLESDVKGTSNKEALLTRFLIKLAQSWTK